MGVRAEGWVIVHITRAGEKDIYKVFASWIDGDRWRVSSGTFDKSQLKDQGDEFIWPQASGSVYILPKEGEGLLTAYTCTVLDDAIKGARDQGTTMKRIKLCD
ncbi:hypothetical protein [uncultured Shewanella sp.]|uniref:hypothetical protein n=1 Tax=uncultured Shewanella sp. TaxID=173975 RepID=UPI002613218C|nr:hypothetical protein [uncultured Shewanella sp.]